MMQNEARSAGRARLDEHRLPEAPMAMPVQDLSRRPLFSGLRPSFLSFLWK